MLTIMTIFLVGFQMGYKLALEAEMERTKNEQT
jgi:hypothetical protein